MKVKTSPSAAQTVAAVCPSTLPFMFSASHRVLKLCHIYEGVDIRLISSDIFVLYKPFNLLFYHFLLWQEHVFQYFYQFSLKLGISNFLPHFHYLDDSLLVGNKRKKIEISGGSNKANTSLIVGSWLRQGSKEMYIFPKTSNIKVICHHKYCT